MIASMTSATYSYTHVEEGHSLSSAIKDVQAAKRELADAERFNQEVRLLILEASRRGGQGAQKLERLLETSKEQDSLDVCVAQRQGVDHTYDTHEKPDLTAIYRFKSRIQSLCDDFEQNSSSFLVAACDASPDFLKDREVLSFLKVMGITYRPRDESESSNVFALEHA